jgi:hypothetical protein
MSPPQIHELAAPSPGALDRNRKLRLAAIVLWSSFLGACAMVIAWMAFVGSFWPTATELSHLSRFFFIAWALALVPSMSAAMLATPHEHGTRDGH